MRLLIILFLVSFSFLTVAQSVNDAALVKQADTQLNDLIRNNNAIEAAYFYAAEFILTTSSGKSKLKNEILAEIGSSDLKLEINTTDQVVVRVLENTAVLTGILHQKGFYKEKEFDARLRVTDTWVKTETGWKLLAGHASIIPKT